MSGPRPEAGAKLNNRLMTDNPPTGALRGGIDLGGTKIEAIVVDSSNKVLGSARHPTPTQGSPADVAAEMATALSEAAQAAGTTTAMRSAVSASDRPARWTIRRDRLQRPQPARLGRDLRAGARAEPDARNARRASAMTSRSPRQPSSSSARVSQYSSLLGLFWGTGVGGGLILNRAPWRGRGGAGEIGHMVIRRGGRRCPCGNEGCVEAYAGRAAMEAHARREIEGGRKSDLLKIMEHKDRERFTSAVWATAVERDDELAVELIDGAVQALGAGAASAVNLLDIEAVLIGGGLGVRFGDEYVDRVREAMTKHLFPGRKMPEVRLVGLGDLGGALGAALLVDGSSA